MRLSATILGTVRSLTHPSYTRLYCLPAPAAVFYGNEFLLLAGETARSCTCAAATPKCDVNQIYITKIKRYEPFNSDWKDVGRNCFQTFYR